MWSVCAFTAAIWLASLAAADVDPIIIKGAKFFYKTNGTEFFMRGVAYQQDFAGNGSTQTSSGASTYTDPLADSDACARDLPYLIKLRTNIIRTYAIDPTKNHDACMKMLANAGIYVVSDLGEPANSINRDTPAWNAEVYARYAAVVDNMAQYTNTLGFFAGNEVSNAPNNTFASAFVKAAVRDVKAYIKQKNYRPLGVGYATNDDETRTNLADYFDCGDAASAIDFWGYNIYSWCGDSDYKTSRYEERTKEFSTYNVPAFFAEYGCNEETPRKFTEVAALYGKDMSKVWSGGIVYMYFQEDNNYGLVSLGSDAKITTRQDYSYLSSAMASVSPTGVAIASYSPTNQPQACPTFGASWEASTKLPPTPNNATCACMYSNLTCVAKPEISDTDVESAFSYLCDSRNGKNCGGISANGTTGVYGAWSMCNTQQRLSWALNAYYFNQKATNTQNTNPCDFSGNAHKVSPRPASSCSAIFSQAGAAGTGAITNAPTATGGSSAASGTSTKGAAGITSFPAFNFGMLRLGAYVGSAVVVGMGMLLL